MLLLWGVCMWGVGWVEGFFLFVLFATVCLFSSCCWVCCWDCLLFVCLFFVLFLLLLFCCLFFFFLGGGGDNAMNIGQKQTLSSTIFYYHIVELTTLGQVYATRPTTTQHPLIRE